MTSTPVALPLTTHGLVVKSPGGEFESTELTIPELRDDEILVRIVATGLCHTDLSVRDTLPGEMFPRVLGHEGAGVVEMVGSQVEGFEVGDHVVASFRACGACTNCRELGVGYCENTVVLNYMGYRLDGSTTLQADGEPVQASFFGQSSLARHAVVSADNAVRVDPSLDLQTLAPYGCAFQTGAGTVLNVLRPDAGDSLVVYGVGAVGLTAVATAIAEGVRTVVAVDLKPERLQQAAALGAVTVNPQELDGTGFVDRIREVTAGGASHSVDTTGVAAVVRDAALALRPRGVLVLLGLGASEVTFDSVDVMMNGKVIRGSVEGDCDPHRDIPELIARSVQGTFPVRDLITFYPATEANQAAADLLSGAVVKPVLLWD